MFVSKMSPKIDSKLPLLIFRFQITPNLIDLIVLISNLLVKDSNFDRPFISSFGRIKKLAQSFSKVISLKNSLLELNSSPEFSILFNNDLL